MGGNIVSILCEVDRAKAALRTSQGKLGFESSASGMCSFASRLGDNGVDMISGLLRALILDKTTLRVLEANLVWGAVLVLQAVVNCGLRHRVRRRVLE